MHGSMFKNLYFNFSGIFQRNATSSVSFDMTQDQSEESIWEDNEHSLQKLNVFEFAGPNEMKVLPLTTGASVECAWPELLYRRLVLGFLGMVFVAFLVNVF